MKFSVIWKGREVEVEAAENASVEDVLLASMTQLDLPADLTTLNIIGNTSSGDYSLSEKAPKEEAIAVTVKQ